MKWLFDLLGIDPAHPDQEMKEAVELLVEGTEPRLRLVPGYYRKLEPALRVALEHIDTTVEQIPGPLCVSRGGFQSDPEVRAFFATPGELQDVFAGSPEMTEFFAEPSSGNVENAWALLCANKKEKVIIGADLAGSELRHDVLQTAINFYDHKVLAPAGDEASVRAGIKQCILDGLITYVLKHIVNLRSERRNLEDQRRILHARLRARGRISNGLSAMIADAGDRQEQAELIQAELTDVEQKLGELPPSESVLQHYLDEMREILCHPDDFIQMHVACFRLTDMGIQVDVASSQPSNTVCFSELEVARVLKRVVTIVRYPRAEMRVGG